MRNLIKTSGLVNVRSVTKCVNDIKPMIVLELLKKRLVLTDSKGSVKRVVPVMEVFQHFLFTKFKRIDKSVVEEFGEFIHNLVLYIGKMNKHYKRDKFIIKTKLFFMRRDIVIKKKEEKKEDGVLNKNCTMEKESVKGSDYGVLDLADIEELESGVEQKSVEKKETKKSLLKESYKFLENSKNNKTHYQDNNNGEIQRRPFNCVRTYEYTYPYLDINRENERSIQESSLTKSSLNIEQMNFEEVNENLKENRNYHLLKELFVNMAQSINK